MLLKVATLELAASFENRGDGSDGKKHNPREFHDSPV
jgi:hypothetical protein